MKSNIDRASVSHDEALVRELRADPAFAAEYLQAAMEDTGEPAVLLIALRHVSEAFGMAEVAREAGIKRESLYRALSPKGNPTLKTLTAVLKAVGLRLAVAPDASEHRAACA
ncbi:putative addiction module antidote protein [Desulfarculus baarsii DSM 2075]|uniref:Addiction module antidote protein n=1 Tax=Desulfarculus baarsii (strain ATCC 33931 / DSM 2075 / LMG 7858 / VKM B-1802 / 2st14) TaxID=644282 RepID=E1QK66_DESB2|nr:addiction module antidote protein [Desulfarculus baarsii]ADK85959.1 putative addiction module antidote protein [Desulfarculus baarsii DSM 2075]